MGRRKSKRKSSSSSSSSSGVFNPIEKDVLESYLTYYQRAATKLCCHTEEAPQLQSQAQAQAQSQAKAQTQTQTQTQAPTHVLIDQDEEEDEEETIRVSNCQTSSFEKSPTIIAGHEFPALTRDVLARPYLDLPHTLGSKHRRIVFDVCIHAKLYQTSVGEKFVSSTPPTENETTQNSNGNDNGNDNDNSIISHNSNNSNNSNNSARRKVVSIHPDGFDFLNEADKKCHQPPPSFPIMRCLPWYFRNDIGRESSHCTNTYTKESVNNSNSDSISNSNRNSPSTSMSHFMSRHKVRETTKRYQNVIREMVDYPHLCLREGIDSIHYFFKEHQEDHGHTWAGKDNDNSNSNSYNTAKTIQIMVDTADKMKQCADDLLNENNKISELAFDLEAYNASKYKQATCLLQLCTCTNTSTNTSTNTNIGNIKEYKIYIIDVLAPGVWDHVSLLIPIFANPSIVKIGHGISSIDVPCLHRDFGIFIVNCFDTLEGAKVLSSSASSLAYNGGKNKSLSLSSLRKLKNHLSLAKLCKFYGMQDEEEAERYLQLKGEFQTTDWRLRPLERDMVEYGMLDVRFLIDLRRLLVRDMIQLVDGDSDVDNGDGRDGNGNGDNGDNSDANGHGGYDLGLDVLNSFNSFGDDDEDDDCDGDKFQLSNSIIEEDENDLRDEEADDGGGGGGGEEIVNNEEEEDGYYTADSQTIPQSSDDDENEFHPTFEENVEDDKNSIERLRYNDILMNALSKSQKQCLSLWTDKNEVPEKNETLVGLMRRAERLRGGNGTSGMNSNEGGNGGGTRKKKVWDRSDMLLYKDLFEWRDEISKKIGIMPAMMCSLDFLVHIAYTRPTTVNELKRINYFLPDFFRDECNSEHLRDLFSIVLAAAAGKQLDRNSNIETGLYVDRFRSHKNRNSKRKEKKEEMEPKEHDLDPDSSAAERQLERNFRKSTLKLTAIVAGIAVFWIGVTNRKKRLT